MIVRRMASGSRIVTQADHARLGCDLLRLFRLPELVGHPRRELLLRAVGEHDNGWWEADAAPRRSPDGRSALGFHEVSTGLRREIWRRGIERFASDSPYLAALIATHALRLASRFGGLVEWDDFCAETSARRLELLETAGARLSDVAEDDRWLELADGLSLAVCAGDPAWCQVAGWRISLRGDPGSDEVELGVDPFPLAGTTRFGLSFRRLPDRSFESDTDLGVALVSAPWARLSVRLTRA